MKMKFDLSEKTKAIFLVDGAVKIYNEESYIILTLAEVSNLIEIKNEKEVNGN